MDNSRSEEFHPSPFRQEVTSAEHERILNFNKNIENGKTLYSNPTDGPTMATLFGEMVMDKDVPNESKMLAFGNAVDLIRNPAYPKQNIDVAHQLIDMIRAQNDKGLRMRLASIISAQMQETDVDKGLENTHGKQVPSHNDSRDMGEQRGLKISSFASIAANLNGNEPEVYQRYAKYLIDGKGMLTVYNHLYRLNTDLVINPDIIREITEESENLNSTDEELSKDDFIGDLIKLDPPRLPTIEKIEQWREYAEKNGLPHQYLPVNIVRREGSKFISIEFHPSMTERLGQLVKRMRDLQDILNPAQVKQARHQIFEEAHALGAELMESLNEEQRNEFLSGANVHVRFSTGRNVARDTNQSDIDADEKDSQMEEQNSPITEAAMQSTQQPVREPVLA